jgi:hypothetical protein
MQLFTRRGFSADEGLRCRVDASFVPCLSCLVILFISALTVAAHGGLTKISPDSVEVQLQNGVGFVSIFFNPKTCTKMPQIQITDAVGTTNAIPRTDIHFNWETQFPNRGTLAEARLDVNTQGFVFRNTEYKGRIFFIWEGEKQITPQALDFTVVDRSTVAFELYPEKSDVMLGVGRPEVIMVRIKNTGKTNISSVSISSLDLADGATKNRTTFPTIVKNNLTIEPEKEDDITIDLPKPVLAGTYSGVLDLQANGKERKSVLLTLRTRGPNFIPWLSQVDRFAYLPWLPIVLFFLTLFAGFGVSRLLEDWFGGGGLQRATDTVSLLRSQESLAEKNDQIRNLDPTLGALPQTATILEASLIDLGTTLRQAAGAETEQQLLEHLSRESKRFADRVAFTDALWTAVQTARDSLANNPEGLRQTISLLDGETPPDADMKDLVAYRSNLQNIVKSAVTGIDLGKSVRLTKALSAKNIQTSISRMRRLHRVAVWFIVFVIAYQTFYANNFAFGTLLDYFAVLLWSFGLTQTGTQIVQRVRAANATNKH